MNEVDAVRRLFGPFHEELGRSGLFTDFDGTLSSIVDDPSTAGPVAGAIDALGAAASVLATVWVVTGRPVSYLGPLLPAGVHLSGLYGLETWCEGVRTEHPDAGRWRDVVDGVAERAEAELVGVGVERKGLALTLHFREQAAMEAAVGSFADRWAKESGLAIHPGRRSVELRPPIEVDKGTVVESAAAGLAAAAFIGDDRGDLAAFDALDRLAARGTAVVRVAVHSLEAPQELLDRADLVVDGPAAVVQLLRALVEPPV